MKANENTQKFLQMLQERGDEAPQTVMLEHTMEEMAKIPTHTDLVPPVAVRMEAPRLIYRRTGIRADSNVPCVAHILRYHAVAYLSSVKETLGQVQEDVRVDVLGYEAEMDANSRPVVVLTDDGQEAWKEITVDENGQEKEPMVLMSWRLAFGRNTSRNEYNRPAGPDLIVRPSHHVPRHPAFQDRPGEGGTTVKTEIGLGNVNFSLVPGLENDIKRPIRNMIVLGLDQLEPIVEKIPTYATDQPGAQRRGYAPRTGGTVQEAKAATSSTEDVFAEAPKVDTPAPTKANTAKVKK